MKRKRGPKYMKLLGKITDYVYEENGVTSQEVAKQFGFSNQTAVKALKILVNRNEITKGCDRRADGTIVGGTQPRALYLPY